MTINEIQLQNDGTVRVAGDNERYRQNSFPLEIATLLEAIWNLPQYQEWILQGFPGCILEEITMTKNGYLSVLEKVNNKNYRFSTYPDDPNLSDSQVIPPVTIPLFQEIWNDLEYQNWSEYVPPSSETPMP
jgi:hypothetical protein